MKSANPFFQVRYFMYVGLVGFGLGFLLSLVGGNLVETSLKRGLIGIISFILIYLILAVFISPLQQSINSQDGKQTETENSDTKSLIDVSLPAEAPDTPPTAADFKPWIIGNASDHTEEQARHFAEAVRKMQEE